MAIKHKTNLALVAEDIAKALKEKTNDYRLGYGSYRDKPRSPFGAGKQLLNIAVFRQLYI